MSNRPTICAECKHFREHVGPYRYWCNAEPVVDTPERFDFVRGRKIEATYLPRDVARWDKNTGECEFFELLPAPEPKPVSWWRRVLRKESA